MFGINITLRYWSEQFEVNACDSLSLGNEVKKEINDRHMTNESLFDVYFLMRQFHRQCK